jgi:hypothetical protein
VFVLRTSSTSVVTWFWQKKVVCGACDFRYPTEFSLLEKLSPSRRIFIGSHLLPSLWLLVRSFTSSLCFVLQWIHNTWVIMKLYVYYYWFVSSLLVLVVRMESV